MAEQDEQFKGAPAGGPSEFEAMFEERPAHRQTLAASSKQGRWYHGNPCADRRWLQIRRQIPIQEFTDREGHVQVKVGDDVDVFFDSSESEGGGLYYRGNGRKFETLGRAGKSL